MEKHQIGLPPIVATYPILLLQFFSQVEKSYRINTWLKQKCVEDPWYPTMEFCSKRNFDKNFLCKYCNCDFGKWPENWAQPPEFKITAENCTFCSPYEFYECFQKHYDIFVTGLTQSRKKCIEPCVTTTFHRQDSWTIFRMKSNSKDVAPSILHVYFDDFHVTVVREINTITFASVLANVGGAMGVFLGASLISLVEIFILGFDILKQLLSRKSTVFPLKSARSSKSTGSVKSVPRWWILEKWIHGF